MKEKLIRGTFVLTAAGLFCRFAGFFYRIFLSQTIGAEGMGIYQLIFPVYNLCFAIAAAGIQTALSRMIAARLAKKEGQEARDLFLAGLFCSVSISCVLSALLYGQSSWISSVLLSESRCIPLLKMLSLSLPLGTVHACINGYFFAQKQTRVPAILQITEQLVRIGSSVLFYFVFQALHKPITPMIAVIGLLIGECIASFCSVLVLLTRFRSQNFAPMHPGKCISYLPPLFRLSFPLTLNRVLLNLLHSIEAILIPWSLRRQAMSVDTALSTFGVLTGMSLPLILFPTALTNSLSTILLPVIAEEQALGNHKAILKIVRSASLFALSIGVLFAGIFYMIGPLAGNVIFHNEQAGHFIRTLSFISPFLYINTTLSSVLNGLGKTFTCFFINTADLCVRICFILFLIPTLGITAYLYGLLAGEILCTLLSLLALAHFLSSHK